MKKAPDIKKSLRRKVFALIAVALAFGILIIIRQFQSASEFWTRTYYRFLQSAFGPLASLVPFSLAEAFFILFGAALVILVVFIIVDLAKKRYWPSLDKLAMLSLVTLTTFACYFSTAGIAYGRSEVDIPQYQGEVEYTRYVEVVEHFIADFNYCASELDFDESGSVIKPYTIAELSVLLKMEYAELESDYFVAFTPNVKPMFLSFLFTEFHITGVFFAPTTEPNVNYLTTDAQIASTMAHEIAHAKGAMREEDANLVAAYILLNSDDPYLRYSGYITTFYSIIGLADYVGDDDKHHELYNSLSPDIRSDCKYMSEYWKAHDLLDDIATWFNNLYLSIVGNEGVSSYVDSPTTGETTDPDTGETISYIEEFSPFQKLYLHFFFED